MANVLPLVGLQLTLATEQLSDAVGAEKLTTAPAGEVASVTMLSGQMMVGGVVSTTGACASSAPMSVPSPPVTFGTAGSSKVRENPSSRWSVEEALKL